MRLQNKRAVVTGAGGGIGSTTARYFAREGARVVIAEVDEQSGTAAAEAIRADGGEATFVQADVTDLDSVGDLVGRAEELLGGIDVWMNNAGDSKTEDLLETDPAAWLDDLDLNLTAHYLCCKAVVPVMQRSGGGSIINISSVNGLWAIGEVGYSAAKAGLISLSRNIAVRYGRDGIRANVICPGTILTPRGAAYWDQKAGSVDKLLRWYPVGRLGKPEDVASLAVYLAGDESAFATGAVFVLDGGLTAGTTLFGT
jgi:NAD(P)-dependent dehydrogenase (short-subunit alcohol dehydrogenase family)